MTSLCGTGSGCRKPSPLTLLPRCRRVTQTSELREAMTESITSDTLTLVEVMLPKMDIPDFLRAVTQALEERNSRV